MDAATLQQEFDELTRFLADCDTAANAGEPVDLGDTDLWVDELCHYLRTLPADAANALAPRLREVLDRLDGLYATLEKHAGPELRMRQTRASAAYSGTTGM